MKLFGLFPIDHLFAYIAASIYFLDGLFGVISYFGLILQHFSILACYLLNNLINGSSRSLTLVTFVEVRKY